MNIKTTAWGIALAALLSLTACGGGGGGIGGTGAQQGTLSVSITDAPACGYDQVNVTIEKVRVHQSVTAPDSDAGWSEIVLSPPRRIDLLTLTNGVLDHLGETTLPAGRYTQLRLVLADNSVAHPFANSVVPTGGVETALTTPSGQQSGLKLNADIDVPAGQVLDVALDFDACKSIVKRGNSGGYNLKPVLTITPLLGDAGLRVVGHVDPTIALTSTHVSVQLNGVPVKATPPDTTGRFMLYPVPAGQYDLVISAAGRVTAVMTGVPVVSGTPTTVNSATLRINPPLATPRPVTGRVTPATATLRAMQSFTGGPNVEVAWAPVDALSGDFSLQLPIGAPVKLAYMANPSTLAFVPDTAAANLFTLQAASAGATMTQAIDVTGAVAPVAIAFP